MTMQILLLGSFVAALVGEAVACVSSNCLRGNDHHLPRRGRCLHTCT